MAVSIGKGRYYKLFAGNSPPKRLLIEDINEPGLLSDEYVQGIVIKVFPVKNSERFGKLCKLVLKEDVEKAARHAPCATINVFLLGDVAKEGESVCEGDRMVLTEAFVECSPTNEHLFQLIVWREKSDVSVWVISKRGKVKANTVNGGDILHRSTENGGEFEKGAATENGNDSEEEEHAIYQSCEYDFTQQSVDDEQPERVGEKRKGKFQLGPRAVTPSHVKRSLSNVVVLRDKSTSTCTNASAELKISNVNASGNTANNALPSIAVEAGRQSMVMSQKAAPGGNGQSASLCLQSANGTPLSLSNVMVLHDKVNDAHVAKTLQHEESYTKSTSTCTNASAELNISNVNASGNTANNALPSIAVEAGRQAMVMSQKAAPGGNGQSASLCLQSANGTPLRDLPQLMAIDSERHSQSTVGESNVTASVEGANTAAKTAAFNIDGDALEATATSTERTAALNEDHTNLSLGRVVFLQNDVATTSSVKGLMPSDYTPAASLLMCSKDDVQRSPLRQVIDPKLRLPTTPNSEVGPSQPSPSRDRSPVKAFPVGVRKRSSRATADYTVPPGYTTLANLQPETTVNVYGVVKLFKPAWKCRGTDMCSVLMLMDPTAAESDGLECVSFQPSVSRLPDVHKVGDIVRLHRIKINQYQGRLQAKSSRGFAAVVFDRDADLPVTAEMARVSSSTFTLTQSDKDTVE
ncbi:unnamed protein product [Porites evermanni]|uniref:Telomeric single stranded DNA binding POT1/Cdc13 domain-containing protein n=1 Tax=Porites evermanni TaxID=104178 RepID=A0ABN8SW80_9CNID|nr:unnamed protein product [Porites evermanni]